MHDTMNLDNLVNLKDMFVWKKQCCFVLQDNLVHDTTDLDKLVKE